MALRISLSRILDWTVMVSLNVSVTTSIMPGFEYDHRDNPDGFNDEDSIECSAQSFICEILQNAHEIDAVNG